MVQNTTSFESAADQARTATGARFGEATDAARAWLIDRLPAGVTFHGVELADLTPIETWAAIDHDYLGGWARFIDNQAA